ncbi:MAG: TrkA family potassium uptake protein [Candidatus Nanopelagicales bacterium]|nr:TrkA family potassium uptake protein [Candidatus Nanopelagicales bacterium]
MKIAIAGSGKVGRSIAKELLGRGHSVLLIDRDPAAARPGSVDGAEFLLADACEVSALDNANLSECQVVVAATGDDKVNLVVSLLAKTEYGVPRVIARVNHPKNEWMFDESWGVDVAVSTPRMLVALVDEAVSVGDLVRLFSFRQGNADLVELTLSSDSPVVGKRVGDQAWPTDTALVAIVRGSRVFAPTADDPLDAGDELLFVTAPDQEAALQSMLGHARMA